MEFYKEWILNEYRRLRAARPGESKRWCLTMAYHQWSILND